MEVFYLHILVNEFTIACGSGTSPGGSVGELLRRGGGGGFLGAAGVQEAADLGLGFAQARGPGTNQQGLVVAGEGFFQLALGGVTVSESGAGGEVNGVAAKGLEEVAAGLAGIAAKELENGTRGDKLRRTPDRSGSPGAGFFQPRPGDPLHQVNGASEPGGRGLGGARNQIDQSVFSPAGKRKRRCA